MLFPGLGIERTMGWGVEELQLRIGSGMVEWKGHGTSVSPNKPSIDGMPQSNGNPPLNKLHGAILVRLVLHSTSISSQGVGESQEWVST